MEGAERLGKFSKSASYSSTYRMRDRRFGRRRQRERERETYIQHIHKTRLEKSKSGLMITPSNVGFLRAGTALQQSAAQRYIAYFSEPTTRQSAGASATDFAFAFRRWPVSRELLFLVRPSRVESRRCMYERVKVEVRTLMCMPTTIGLAVS